MSSWRMSLQHLKRNLHKNSLIVSFFLAFLLLRVCSKYIVCSMKLIVGLGNPGNEYIATRHNAGWIALDRIGSHLKASEFRDYHHK